jgi:hypothetical protein
MRGAWTHRFTGDASRLFMAHSDTVDRQTSRSSNGMPLALMAVAEMKWRPRVAYPIRSASGAESAHEKHDDGHQHNEAKKPTADGRSAEIETTTAEEEEEDKNKEYRVHGCIMTRRRAGSYGELTVCSHSRHCCHHLCRDCLAQISTDNR